MPEDEKSMLPAPIAAALASIDATRERVLALAPTAAAVCDAVFGFADTIPGFDIRVGYEINSLQGVNVYCGELFSGLPSIRDAFPLLKALRAAGFKPRGTSDFPEIGRRTYTYRRDGDSVDHSVNVSCFLATGANATGANCCFEQVGVEEKPVYKLVCDGEVVGAAEAAP